MRGTFRFMRKKPLGGFGLLVLLLVVGVGALSPWLAPYGMNDFNLAERLEGPSSRHWFGTDQNGRDLLSRLVYGAQVAAMVGLGTSAFVVLLSLLVGLPSGYFGGKYDVLVQRVVDVWMSFPAIFLILTIVAIFPTAVNRGFLGLGVGPTFGPDPTAGPWFWNTFPRTTVVIFTLGVVLAGNASRIVRSAVVSVKASPYIEAATVLGASHLRIMLRHILPNIMATIIIVATLQLGAAILVEATLSFLGIGITNFPTWGQLLGGNTRALAAQYPHLVIFPSLVLFLAVFGFNVLGDALRDVLDPRFRNRN